MKPAGNNAARGEGKAREARALGPRWTPGSAHGRPRQGPLPPPPSQASELWVCGAGRGPPAVFAEAALAMAGSFPRLAGLARPPAQRQGRFSCQPVPARAPRGVPAAHLEQRGQEDAEPDLEGPHLAHQGKRLLHLHGGGGGDLPPRPGTRIPPAGSPPRTRRDPQRRRLTGEEEEAAARACPKGKRGCSAWSGTATSGFLPALFSWPRSPAPFLCAAAKHPGRTEKSGA